MFGNRLMSLTLITLLVLGLAGCTAQPPTTTTAKNMNVILATSTNTQDTGILDVLLPEFNRQTGYEVRTVAVSSSALVAIGEKGEADVLLMHSPADEKALVDKGFCTERLLVMHNDYIIAGPPADPAGIRGLAATTALQKIAATSSLFISRGDQSSTNVFELGLWKSAGITPVPGPAYYALKQGMGPTLTAAQQHNAYVLSDRSTYMAMKKSLTLIPLVEGDRALFNTYHVLPVNQAVSPRINYEGARAFSDFLAGPATQQIIASFGVDKYSQPLFFADAGKNENSLTNK